MSHQGRISLTSQRLVTPVDVRMLPGHPNTTADFVNAAINRFEKHQLQFGYFPISAMLNALPVERLMNRGYSILHFCEQKPQFRKLAAEHSDHISQLAPDLHVTCIDRRLCQFGGKFNLPEN